MANIEQTPSWCNDDPHYASLVFVMRPVTDQPGATLGELVSAVGLCPSPGFRGLVDWLDLLVSVGCLTRTGACGTCVEVELCSALAMMGLRDQCNTLLRLGSLTRTGVGPEPNLAACMPQKGALGDARRAAATWGSRLCLRVDLAAYMQQSGDE